MTTGIYSLYWEEQDLIYIGQSQDIEGRFKEHNRKLKSGTHSNYKVQNAYNNYGIPSFNIIEESTIEQLNSLEILWQKEFNSLNSLDLVEAGQVGFGVNSNASKYSKLQILLIFRELSNSSLVSCISISKKYGVEDKIASSISSGRNHLWLREKYPKHYSKMLFNKTARKSNSNSKYIMKGIKHTVISPSNIEYTITNIKEFAEQFNLTRSHLNSVLTGKRHSHKGWTLKE